MARYGAQSMSLPLRRVLMRRPDLPMRDADPAAWHYGPGFEPARAAAQHAELVRLVAASGAAIEFLPDRPDGLADSVFVHDPSLVTEEGAIILSMGKVLREPEPALHAEAFAALGIPVLGRIEPPGMVEGGDCVFVDSRTLAIGMGVRTNRDGVGQLERLLSPHQIEVIGYDLPLWAGEDACLHLQSVISPLAPDLALVHAPLLPYAFYRLLRDRGIGLLVAPPDEFEASLGLSLNVLATSPRAVIAVDEFPKTRRLMEEAGCTVSTFVADALCIACEGGPTCLTRPLWRA